MYIKRIINCLIITFITSLPIFSYENFKYDIVGTWASKDVCDYYININDFSSLKKNKFNEKFFTDDGLIIRLSDERCEFGIIGDSNPWKINKFEINKQTITLHCNRILYNYDNNNFNSSISDDSEKILIKIVDNDEIIFDDFSYPKETHFYRISGPAKISIRNAVINDNKVRIRIKPNLKCDTWAYLNKGDKVVIKDISTEQYEINGESWYWYKVDYPELPDGWVYGKYLDIKN